jgi:hypothetical protein
MDLEGRRGLFLSFYRSIRLKLLRETTGESCPD